jgi:hypothetical protein
MDDNIRNLITSGTKIELARLEIDGEPKRQGHGEITLEDQKITLTIIGNSGTSANFGELLEIKAEMTDGKILVVTGCPHKFTSGRYPKIVMHVREVVGRRSGRDPDEQTNEAMEVITANLYFKELAACNGRAVIREEREAIGGIHHEEKLDHLVIEGDRIYVQKRDGLEITYAPNQGECRDAWVPVTAAIAYIHGTVAWPYYKEFQTKGDTDFVLRNDLDLPKTELKPINGLLGDLYPDAAVNVVKSIIGLISTHAFREEIHDILHYFTVGTAYDAVPGTLVATAALEGLCRLLEGKIDSRKPSAKKIIEEAISNLYLGADVVDPGLGSWDRVRNTLAHGHFQRALESCVHPKKPVRAANEGILHDLSRISGLFHAIILKTAGYSGPYCTSILEDKVGRI